jgi:uncharacterized protein (TIGR00730 family)
MRICVFCGSNAGHNPLYAEAARETGRTIAARGMDLIYGGGRVGLMGVLADAALGAGGVVIGVMPQALVDREIQHSGLTDLQIVATMHERKTRMAELADGFLALPGGAGTLEEIFEQWTWAQLGMHSKPCGFLNTLGYFDPVQEMAARMSREGFLRTAHAAMLTFDSDAAAILDAFAGYAAPVSKWQSPPTIRIVAALIQDDAQRLLLVRKKGTRSFMQPGGKLLPSEAPMDALERELREELGCAIRPGSPVFLGTFTAEAANERESVVEAALYRVELLGSVNVGAEIEEAIWIDAGRPCQIELAPLTRDAVWPLAGGRSGTASR